MALATQKHSFPRLSFRTSVLQSSYAYILLRFEEDFLLGAQMCTSGVQMPIKTASPGPVSNTCKPSPLAWLRVPIQLAFCRLGALAWRPITSGRLWFYSREGVSQRPVILSKSLQVRQNCSIHDRSLGNEQSMGDFNVEGRATRGAAHHPRWARALPL